MKTKRFVFNGIVILALLVGLGACQSPATPTATVSPPDTTTPNVEVKTETPVASTITPVPASPADCRKSILKPTEPIHAVHMGGNYGTNMEETNTLPKEYFEYLRDLNVNWVGMTVSLHYDDSMDSTVEREYTGVAIPTFSDGFLREMIQTYQQYGICVYLTLAFEAFAAEDADHPVYRWQLGGLTPIFDDGRIQPEFWPWALDHPDHERFVAEFWESYTEQAVHFGQLAEDAGVALYSLGTETEGLFRTRPSDEWPNDFSKELHAMVAAVREVYSGPLTYDMHFSVFTEPELRGGLGAYNLWEDLGLDVIGLSSYFPLADCPPQIAFPVETLERRWEEIFQQYLIPLKAANPNRPIYFTEFGAVDSLSSPVVASFDEYRERILSDADENGLDDGAEMQANIYHAVFNIMDRYPGVVDGTFLWGMMMAGQEEWAHSFANKREFSVRDKVAENVVRDYYGAEPRTTIPTPIPYSSDTPSYLLGNTCVIFDDRFPIEWWNGWTSNANIYTDSSRVAYSGKQSIEVLLQPHGSFGFSVSPQIDLSPFNWLVFYVSSIETVSQKIGIYLSFRDERLNQPLDISNFIEGNQLNPGQWHQVLVPISEIGANGESIDTITFIEMSGNRSSTFFIDNILFVEEKVSALSTTISLPPTPTPLPTLSPETLGAGTIAYDDALKGRWSIDPWGGAVDLNSSVNAYEGSTAIEVALDPSGAITFDNGSFDTIDYNFLIFYLNGGEIADQQLYVEMKSGDNVPLGERTYLADYIDGYPLQPGQWHMVTIPLSELNPDGESFAWFDLGDASGVGASTFYIDEIRFVAAGQ